MFYISRASSSNTEEQPGRSVVSENRGMKKHQDGDRASVTERGKQ